MACKPEILRDIPLFALLDDEEMAVLAGQVELRTFAARPRFFLLHKKTLYRVDEAGNVLRSAPGPTGNRKYGIIGSRNRKYYLRLLRP